MSSATRFFLLAGCACVLALEAPRTVAVLSDGWSGPYPRVSAAQTLVPPPPTAAAARPTAPLDLVQARFAAPVGLIGLPRR